jgi:hypothetical protein
VPHRFFAGTSNGEFDHLINELAAPRTAKAVPVDDQARLP